MNNKISNPKKEVPNTKNMNDKDYITTILNLEKAIVKGYATALTEASNEVLYNKYKEMFDAYISMQRDVFEFMFRMEWYKLEKADNNKICEKQQMLIQELNSLNS